MKYSRITLSAPMKKIINFLICSSYLLSRCLISLKNLIADTITAEKSSSIEWKSWAGICTVLESTLIPLHSWVYSRIYSKSNGQVSTSYNWLRCSFSSKSTQSMKSLLKYKHIFSFRSPGIIGSISRNSLLWLYSLVTAWLFSIMYIFFDDVLFYFIESY